MTSERDDDKKPNKRKQNARRSDRLAAALRENLRRRKAQVRQRGAAPAPQADPAPHGDKSR